MANVQTQFAASEQPLVGASEAAEIIGIELSTFAHMRKREASSEKSGFPKPTAILRCGPIWKTTDIKRFAKRYVPPKPGPKPAVGNGEVQAAVPTKKAPVKKAAARKAPAKKVARKVAAKKVAKV